GSNWPHVPWPVSTEGFAPDKITLPAKTVDVPVSREARARFYAAMARMDKELGETMEVVDQKLGKNTFVLFSADHGTQWPFGKWNLYDTGTRVPMVVRWQGKIAPGSKTRGMVSWVDILPTLVEVGGGEAPLELDGRSFAAAFRDPKAFGGHSEIYTTHSSDLKMNAYPMRSVRTGKWKYIANLAPDYVFTTHVDLAPAKGDGGYFPAWRRAAQTDANAKRIVDQYYRRPAEELYDLENDPEEERNLAADPAHRAIKEELKLKLNGWRMAQHDDIPLKAPLHREEGPIDGLRRD
ncbi:MAG: sulfatase/phosphatase domain-containing protein, partial [Sphingobium limneticum]